MLSVLIKVMRMVVVMSCGPYSSGSGSCAQSLSGSNEATRIEGKRPIWPQQKLLILQGRKMRILFYFFWRTVRTSDCLWSVFDADS